MSSRFPVCVLILIILLAGTSRTGQAQSTIPDLPLTAAETIVKPVDEVSLLFTVTDVRGRFVSNLNLSDFHVQDNGRLPETVHYFKQAYDLPLRVVLLIDLSSSVRYRFDFEQQAAVAFLKKIIRPGIDGASIIGFNQAVHVVQDFSSEKGKLEKSVRILKPGGDTALFDAIVTASEKLRSKDDAIKRRVIVLISDGVDTASSKTEQDAMMAASRAQASIYALSTDPSVKPSAGKAVLDRLSLNTGGLLLEARQPEELVSAFNRVQTALRSQYLLAYKPAGFERNGSRHTVEVAARKKGLRVHCRTSYLAWMD